MKTELSLVGNFITFRLGFTSYDAFGKRGFAGRYVSATFWSNPLTITMSKFSGRYLPWHEDAHP